MKRRFDWQFLPGPTKHRLLGIRCFDSDGVPESRLPVRGSHKRQKRDTIGSKWLQRPLRHNRTATAKSLRVLRRAAHQR